MSEEPSADAPTIRGDALPRAEKSRRSREAILQAALNHFAANGYRAATVGAIAQEAGMTDAGLLYHFGTKEELLVSVLLAEDEKAAARLGEIRARGDSAMAGLRNWGLAIERSNLTGVHAVLEGEHLVDDGPINEYFRQRKTKVIAHVKSSFDEAMRRGEIVEVDSDAEARTFVAVVDGSRIQYFLSQGANSMAETIDHYLDQLYGRICK